MDDSRVTIADIKGLIKEFVKEREWEKYHSPKNLCMALSVEVAELSEIFQWMSEEESFLDKDDEVKEKVEDEVADVVTYAIELCNVLDIDLASAIFKKFEKNRKKYPVEECKGVYRKR